MTDTEMKITDVNNGQKEERTDNSTLPKAGYIG